MMSHFVAAFGLPWALHSDNGRNIDGTYEDNMTEAYWAITCSDGGPSSASPEELLNQYSMVDHLLGPMFAWSEGGCYNWPFDRGIDLSDVSAPTADPIVVIGTTYDPATPDAWAKALAAQLQVGIYVNFNGDGHTAYRSGSRCIDNLVDAFFIDGVVPTANTSCDKPKSFLAARKAIPRSARSSFTACFGDGFAMTPMF